MKTQHQQSQEANAKRFFGFKSGTASHKILHYLKANKDRSFSSYELADELGMSVSRVAAKLQEGKSIGAFAGHRDSNRCKRTMFYSFKAMPTGPAVKPKKEGPQGGRRHDWAMSQILATRAIKREEAAAIRKSNRTKEGVVIPPDLVVKVAPTPPNLGNRYWVDPASVPKFRYGAANDKALEAA